MNQDFLLEIPEQNKKAYSTAVIILSTLTGGVIAAAYMMVINCAVFSQHRLKGFVIAGAVLLLSINLASIFIPFLDVLSDFIYIIFNALAAFVAVYFLQKQKIHTHRQNGGAFFGGWNIFLVIIVNIFVSFALMVGCYFYSFLQIHGAALR
jgi:hypothetical protein